MKKQATEENARKHHRKMEQLDAAMDKIRSKYGEKSIGRAGLLLRDDNEQ